MLFSVFLYVLDKENQKTLSFCSCNLDFVRVWESIQAVKIQNLGTDGKNVPHIMKKCVSFNFIRCFVVLMETTEGRGQFLSPPGK